MSHDITVTRVFKTRDLTQITLVQTDSPETGRLILGFSNEPYALSKWQVIDSTGAITQVDLEGLKKNVAIEDSLFRYVDPELGKGRRLNQ